MRLKNISILKKIAAVVVVMGLTAAAIAFVGGRELLKMSASFADIGAREESAREAMDLRVDIISISRMTYQVALSPHKAEEFSAEAYRRTEEMLGRLPKIRAVSDATERQLMSKVESALGVYFTAIHKLIEVARTSGPFDQRQIHESLNETLETQKAVTDVVKEYSVYSSKRLEEARQATLASAGKAEVFLAASAVGGILLGALISVLVAQIGITRPLRSLTAAMSRLARGELDTDVGDTRRGDEIGEMTRALEVFKSSLIETRRLEEEARRRDLETAEEKRRMMSQLADDFTRQVGSLVDSVSAAAVELEATAANLSKTAESASSETTNLSETANVTSASVQTVASATEELATTASEIGHRIASTARIAADAVERVRRTDTDVQRLAEGAQKIDDVVSLINQIAGQTNLLALNATIEAARAGEAGKGFAVVASEVKNLAGQTAKATEEIASQIANLQQATATVITTIREIGEAIGHMHEATASVAAAASQQQTATQDIARSVAQAAQSTEMVTSGLTLVRGSAEHAGAGASEVLSAAQELAQNASGLRSAVDSFIHGIRAA